MKHSGNETSGTLAEMRQTLSGLEFFRQMIAGRIAPPPLVAMLGLRLVEADEGRVVFAGTAGEEFYNGMGVAHGGWAATMLDSALGCAINTMMPAGRSFTTLELTINYTRPLRREVGEVRCEATVIHAGNRTATSQGRIVDLNGKIYAHGTTTCIVVETRAAAERTDSGG
jgi:uncharacterized protein (TIGR00369 family)